MESPRTYIRLTHSPINLPELLSLTSSPDIGATSIFLGTTRNTCNNKRVRQLDYEAYESMALTQLQSLANSAMEKWHLGAVAIVHRLGCVPVSEASVAIICTSEHRAGALKATEELIEEVKARVTIWKREVYEDGTMEWKANKEWVYHFS